MNENIQTSEVKLFSLDKGQKIFLFIIAVILWVLTLLSYLNPGFEYFMLQSFQSLANNPTMANLWYLYTKYALYVVSLPILALYFISYKVNFLKPYRLVIFLVLLISAVGSILVDPFLKDLVARPRPWIVYPEIGSLYHPSGLSFPSEHTFEVFALTLPFIICFLTDDGYFIRSKKKIFLALILLIFALTLSFSRLIVGVHYFSDILFSIGFSLFLLVILVSLLQWLLKSGKLNSQNEKWYGLLLVIILITYMLLVH